MHKMRLTVQYTFSLYPGLYELATPFPCTFCGYMHISQKYPNICLFVRCENFRLFSSKHNRSLLKMYGMSMPFLFLFVDK